MKGINLLPVGGELFYYPNFLSESKADFYFEKLHRTIEWEHDETFEELHERLGRVKRKD